MPSASELCNLYNKQELIEEFIKVTTRDVEQAAKQGGKYANVDISTGLTRTDVETSLINAFPECKVKWKWFIQSYRIQWA
jgi:hypothetical protein